MKKYYNNPKVESVKVNAQMHLCDGSPTNGGTQVGGGTLNGGNIPGDPSQNL